jgi:hypothetical protein
MDSEYVVREPGPRVQYVTSNVPAVTLENTKEWCTLTVTNGNTVRLVAFKDKEEVFHYKHVSAFVIATVSSGEHKHTNANDKWVVKVVFRKDTMPPKVKDVEIVFSTLMHDERRPAMQIEFCKWVLERGFDLLIEES